MLNSTTEELVEGTLDGLLLEYSTRCEPPTSLLVPQRCSTISS